MKALISILAAFAMSLGWVVPPAHAATYTPDYTCVIPFLAQGASTVITGTGVTVTATENTAVSGQANGFPSNSYLFQSPSRVKTVLTFSPPVPGIQLRTEFHTDAGAGNFEDFEFVGVGGAFTTNVRNEDTTVTYQTAGNPFTGLLSELTINYTFDNRGPRGSLLYLGLSCVGLSPSTQTVAGEVGTALSTSSFTETGFLGTRTYRVSAGSLPAGLTLNTSTGVISGTPTSPSSGTVTVEVTGADFGTSTATVTFAINPDPSPTPTPTPTPTPSPSGKQAQVPVSSLRLPKTVKPYRWVTLVKTPVKTNAGQTARVRVTCLPLSHRLTPRGDVTLCEVKRSRKGAVRVKAWVAPIRVIVGLTAPATDNYKRYAFSKTYRVR